ncbi:MAG: GNAT family N-acetyltransferase [Planctomycetota bacterium]|jgi:ribosomal protein S18 acetylase RimI-like enzyme
MGFTLREMTMADYDGVLPLWAESEGIILDESDSRDAIALYLARNTGLCFVAESEGRIIGVVLCGHEGRRGILRHLAVEVKSRRSGVARALLDASLAGLAAQGIAKCNIFVLDENVEGQRFWEHMGWRPLPRDWGLMQKPTGP